MWHLPETRPSLGACLHTLTPAAVCLLLGNLLDAILTLTLLELGWAEEVNPILRRAYDASPLTFVIGKLSMVQLSILIVALPGMEGMRRLLARSGALLYASVV